MFQTVLEHNQDREYNVIDLCVCPNEKDNVLYGTLVQSPVPFHVLDTSRAGRWETAAVSARLFIMLCSVVHLNSFQFEQNLREAFPSLMKKEDQYFRKRGASKSYSISIA